MVALKNALGFVTVIFTTFTLVRGSVLPHAYGKDHLILRRAELGETWEQL